MTRYAALKIVAPNKRELNARADRWSQIMTMPPIERGELDVPIWFGAQVDELRLLAFGVRPTGGGAHQSKTMIVNRRWIGTPYRHPKGTPLSGEFGR
jgi:hypothetical protein